MNFSVRTDYPEEKTPLTLDPMAVSPVRRTGYYSTSGIPLGWYLDLPSVLCIAWNSFMYMVEIMACNYEWASNDERELKNALLRKTFHRIVEAHRNAQNYMEFQDPFVKVMQEPLRRTNGLLHCLFRYPSIENYPLQPLLPRHRECAITKLFIIIRFR